VLVLPETAAPDSDNWSILAVPNKFSCFSNDGGNQRFELNAGLGGIQDPAGRCEVLFETRRHPYPVYARTISEIGDCFRALVSRYHSARSDSRTKFWFAFKNLGKLAGGTLDHEHWQLYSLPFIPPAIQDRYGRAAQYYNQNDHSNYRQVFDREHASGDRVVASTSHFLTFVPFAAEMPYELCIAPLRDSADFSTMTEEELNDFAGAFRDAIERLYTVHPELAFNVTLHTAAFEHVSAPWYCWHLSILPRLTTFAGVELGLNIIVNPVTPEEAASTLRAISV
jgi:UDPglucose--hexose-1-phosphate uridylyltransferase